MHPCSQMYIGMYTSLCLNLPDGDCKKGWGLKLLRVLQFLGVWDLCAILSVSRITPHAATAQLLHCVGQQTLLAHQRAAGVHAY